MANRNRDPAQEAAYRKANRDKYKQRSAAWRRDNPDRAKAHVNGWVARNKERHLENGRRWHRENPHRRAVPDAARRARMRGAVAKLSAEEWGAILDEFGHRCAYCGRAGKMTQDHVQPIARGGAHAAGNVVPACKSCNASKGAKPLLAWLAHRFGSS